MKTAVEWLVDELSLKSKALKIMLNAHKEIIEQGKEMELHQRQEDTNYGYSQGWDDGNQNKEPMRPELKQQEQ